MSRTLSYMLFLSLAFPGSGQFGSHLVDLYKQPNKFVCFLLVNTSAYRRYFKAGRNFGSSLIGDIQEPAVIQV